ncbi:MAG: hypothetical protein HON90_06420 [Halobacteriovoraceae bacterium]|jgi:hypothetical protein|nr:hypothetical protein [Halobacteriovoraceae bacterium]
MKKLLAIILVSLSINAFAVTTGKSFSVKFTGDSEAEVMEQAEAAIPKIKNFTYKRLKRDMSMEHCWPLRAKYIEISGLGIGKSYEYVNGELTAVYTGRLSIWHTSCWEPK